MIDPVERIKSIQTDVVDTPAQKFYSLIFLSFFPSVINGTLTVTVALVLAVLVGQGQVCGEVQP